MKKVFIAAFLFLLTCSVFADAANIVVPYILKAPEPITVDGNLEEWGFAFPLDHNALSIPDSGRFKDVGTWVPESFEDCSGTIYMMYDEDYFYVAASVMDDAPGHFSDASWAADAIEFYMANWDIGDALFPAAHDSGGFPDTPQGDYAFQITIAFDASMDSIWAHKWHNGEKELASENTEFHYEIWPDGDGYNMEGKIYLDDLISGNGTGNRFEFTPGTRIPFTWSLYDMDESENSGDFQGFAYTPKGYAGWMGVGPGFQSCDVLETPRGFAWEDESKFDFVSPYIKKAYRPVTVDGNLEEWNFCFPLDHWQTTMPDSGRFFDANWVPEDPEDLKGTIYMMYDDDYFYVAAKVMDDAPGHFSDASWAADAVEYYIANWDIGDQLIPAPHDSGGYPDTPQGDYGFQFTLAYDASMDSIWAHKWHNGEKELASENTEFYYEVWPDGDGYNMEGKIYLPEVESGNGTGNNLKFDLGTRIPMTWSLYDMDETENSGDFMGMAYTSKGYAGWMGVGPGFQYADVKDISIVEYIDEVFPNLPTAIKDNSNPSIVKSFSLEQNYPNPFNPTTNIRFSLERANKVTLEIYNVTGQLVKTVINERLSAGTYVETLNLSNMSSGVYFAVLNNGSNTLTRKMMMIK